MTFQSLTNGNLRATLEEKIQHAFVASFSRCPKMSAITSIRKIKQLGRTQIPDKSVVHSRLHNLSLPTD